MEKYNLITTNDSNGKEIQLYSNQDKSKYFIEENINGAVHPVDYNSLQDAAAHLQQSAGLTDEQLTELLAVNTEDK